MRRGARMVLLSVWVLGTGCGGGGEADPGTDAPSGAEESQLTWTDVQTVEDRLLTLEGFSGPEAVRYDPAQDVYFVGNFNGDAMERDANGFVSRVDAADGTVSDLHFVQGGPDLPLHSPRGMYITGDTLWVVDIDGLHGFNSETGDAMTFVDLSGFEPGFLNDVSQGPDGAMYVTDTGRSAVYRVSGEDAAEAIADPALGNPNGITWDASAGSLFVVPWDPGHPVHRWVPGQTPIPFGPEATEGRLDGVEPLSGGRLLVASQSDESLHLMDAEGTRAVITVGGPPADIGLDTRRDRVAVPYIALNRVDIWQLPPLSGGGG